MKNSYKVSFVIPCYNHGQFIMDAISSVEKCPADLYELIIVDDGSTDPATRELMSTLRSDGYSVITLEKNMGLGSARNTGIGAANGEYIIPLDSDNKIRPEFVQNAVRLLDQNDGIAVVHSDFQYFGEADFYCRIPAFDIKAMLYKNYIDACSVFRKTVWEDCGGYDTKMPVQGAEDWEFWLNAYSRGWKFAHLSEAGFDYRYRTGSMLENLKSDENWKKNSDYLFKKYAHLLKTEYDDLQSWKYHGLQFRRRPLRTAFRLVASALFPKLHKRLYRID